MGETLEARFSNNPNVEINNTPNQPRKYHRWGNCLVGWTHGDSGKVASLFNAMSVDNPIDFGETKFRAMHIGHLHKKKKTEFSLVRNDEEFGLDVEVCPALSPTDVWHNNNLFIGNLRRCKTFMWHKYEGLIDEHYFNLKETRNKKVDSR